MLQDLKQYQKMKAAEIRGLPKDILQELARLKQRNGNASALARKAQSVLFNMAGCAFTRDHNPHNSHRDAKCLGMGHN